jgi:hypothetical protein
MKASRFLIYSRKELINELKDFYNDTVKDQTIDLISNGNSSRILPKIIYEKGINNLTNEELVKLASFLGDIALDSDTTIDAVMLYDDGRLFTIMSDISFVDLKDYVNPTVPTVKNATVKRKVKN